MTGDWFPCAVKEQEDHAITRAPKRKRQNDASPSREVMDGMKIAEGGAGDIFRPGQIR